jgi:hypothetical protein
MVNNRECEGKASGSIRLADPCPNSNSTLQMKVIRILISRPIGMTGWNTAWE